MGEQMKGVSPSFRARADSAAFYEAWVGAVLARAGLYTIHHPFVADGGEYHGQTWDLDVYKEPLDLTWSNVDVRSLGSSSLIPVEVKSLSLTFYNPDTYPFDDVLVCSQNSWLKKWPGKNTVQRDFLMVSRPTGSLVWVPKGTPVTLGVDVFDSTRREAYKAVKTGREYLRPLADFVEMVENHGT